MIDDTLPHVDFKSVVFIIHIPFLEQHLVQRDTRGLLLMLLLQETDETSIATGRRVCSQVWQKYSCSVLKKKIIMIN